MLHLDQVELATEAFLPALLHGFTLEEAVEFWGVEQVRAQLVRL